MARDTGVLPVTRVLVTGANGFIGAQLVKVLLDRHCQVAALVRPASRLDRLADRLERLLVLRCQLADRPRLSQYLTDFRPDVCLHLAWYAEPGHYLTSSTNIESLTDSLALQQALIGAGCRHMVVTGTCAEYDTDCGYLRENSPLRPQTLYAATKHSLQVIGSAVATAAGMRFAWARLFFLYGPGEDERRMVPALIKSLLTGQHFRATSGEQIRDYLHVEDVATALWAIAARGLVGPVNIASGQPISVRAMMQQLAGAIGRPELVDFGSLPHRAWEPPFIVGDNTRLRTETDWQPHYADQQAGLEATIAWWRRRLAEG
jgi:nucleoside-diphosphate-sugar epimerase